MFPKSLEIHKLDSKKPHTPSDLSQWFNILQLLETARKAMALYFWSVTETVCSGSIVVTTLDCGPRGSWFESRVGANILWGSIDCKGLTRAFIPSG